MQHKKLKKALKDVLAAGRVEKFKKIVNESERWLADNPTVTEDMKAAFQKILEEHLDLLEGKLEPDTREAHVNLRLNTEDLGKMIAKRLDTTTRETVERLNITWVRLLGYNDRAAGMAWKYSKNLLGKWFFEYFKDEGFTVRLSDQRLVDFKNIDKMVESLGSQFEAIIAWDIPSYYGIDLSPIDWKDLYNKVQLYYYHRGITDDFVSVNSNEDDQAEDDQAYGFHEDKRNQAEGLANKILHKYKLDWAQVLKPYHHVLEDWYEDVRNQGKDPDHLLNLKQPKELQNVGVDTPKVAV